MAILSCDKGDIIYTLTRRKGMKNIRLRIKGDGSVRVSADVAVSSDVIEDFIRRNADWIFERLPERGGAAEDDTLRTGTGLRIFGSVLRLEITEGEPEDARQEDDRLVVVTADAADQSRIRQLIIGFIAERGREVLDGYYRDFLARSGYTGQPPQLILKLLTGKWGHCDRKNGQIMLNFALCGLPASLAMYVAAHEVAHLLVPDHSPEFYKAGERLYPGFRKYDRELNSYTTTLWRNVVDFPGEPF